MEDTNWDEKFQMLLSYCDNCKTQCLTCNNYKNTRCAICKKEGVFYNLVSQNYLDILSFAKNGNPYAQCLIGFCYTNGVVVKKDDSESLKWYKKSAEQGYDIAQYNLGYCYYYGNGVEKIFPKAFKWFLKAAKQGNKQSQFKIGQCYENGYGVEVNYTEAFAWYEKSAKQGYVCGICNLGGCYLNGIGVSRDYKKAVELFSNLTEKDIAGGQQKLAVCYEKGRGLEKNFEKAFEWYLKAAKQGNANCQCKVGFCYKEGKGVKQDYEKAYEWFLKSAEQDNAYAQYELGSCFYCGNGVEQNLEKTAYWYAKAVKNGVARQSILDMVQKKIKTYNLQKSQIQRSCSNINTSLDYKFDIYQQRVINAEKGYYLVLAPPGCGKTELLTQRVIKAYKEGIPFSDMLCLTFTNRAARGMQERISKNIKEESSNLFVGNIHRFCTRFLSENNLIGNNVNIIDEIDQESIMNEFGLEAYNEEKSYALQIRVHDIQREASHLYQIRNSHPQSVWLDWNQDASKKEEINRIAIEYNKYKDEHNLIDFDDVLLITYTHLMKSTYKELKYTDFHWIQIDEVQDLNCLQFAIVDKITAPKDCSVVYLGDEQQAIFSFMGAKLSNLEMLRNRCGGNLLRLYKNYRSPQYLLDIFNTYAKSELQVAPELLPNTDNKLSSSSDAVQIKLSENEYAERETIYNYIQDCFLKNPQEKIGVLVRTNKDADYISKYLVSKNINHFRISGQDSFKSDSFKTLLSHFSVVQNDTKYLDWARIFSATKTISSYAEARKLVKEMKDFSITPTDFLCYNKSSYVKEFVKSYKNKEIVVFDTETTGTNVFEDDIIQIAAVKVKNGEIVPNSEFNLILETSKEIPKMLGDIVNPMYEEYYKSERCNPKVALEKFLDYIGTDEVLGHNVNYDYNILENNLSRQKCKRHKLSLSIPFYWDSLKLIRLLEPSMKRHRLKDCLEELHLSGANSHKADDDILATKSLIDYCYNVAQKKLDGIDEYLSRNTLLISSFSETYAPLYHHTKSLLYNPNIDAVNDFSFLKEFRYVYEHLLAKQFIEPLSNFDYIVKFIQESIFKPDIDKRFLDQINQTNIRAIQTLTEADLCDSNIIKERVYLMTVYKAKGLEFDNVFVTNVSDGRYPWFSSKTMEQRLEDARLLYVALSRAKKRLCVSYVKTSSSRFRQRRSPFMACVERYFL